jgi:hypothetical protein
MSSKRKQRRIKARQPCEPSKLPDPFSRNNGALVDREEQAQNDAEHACPCCIDRAYEIEANRWAHDVAVWAGKEGEKEK